MGVDSGLPTFRGRHALVSPLLKRMNLEYVDICNPKWFTENPGFAWEFWASCRQEYARATPHEGYHIIRRWAEAMPWGSFCFTTNIDSQWELTDWAPERLFERHGSALFVQCSQPCCSLVWSDVVRTSKRKGRHDLPQCEWCRSLARPNVFMFSDMGFVRDERGTAQQQNYKHWLRHLDQALHGRSGKSDSDVAPSRVVCLEIGAGTAVPHVRSEMEKVAQDMNGQLIRINLEEPQLPQGLQDRAVSIPHSALHALLEIDRLVQGAVSRPVAFDPVSGDTADNVGKAVQSRESKKRKKTGQRRAKVNGIIDVESSGDDVDA